MGREECSVAFEIRQEVPSCPLCVGTRRRMCAPCRLLAVPWAHRGPIRMLPHNLNALNPAYLIDLHLVAGAVAR